MLPAVLLLQLVHGEGIPNAVWVIGVALDRRYFVYVVRAVIHRVRKPRRVFGRFKPATIQILASRVMHSKTNARCEAEVIRLTLRQRRPTLVCSHTQ